MWILNHSPLGSGTPSHHRFTYGWEVVGVTERMEWKVSLDRSTWLVVWSLLILPVIRRDFPILSLEDILSDIDESFSPWNKRLTLWTTTEEEGLPVISPVLQLEDTVDRMGPHTISKWMRVRRISIIDEPVEGGHIENRRKERSIPRSSLKQINVPNQGSGKPIMNICSTASLSC